MVIKKHKRYLLYWPDDDAPYVLFKTLYRACVASSPGMSVWKVEVIDSDEQEAFPNGELTSVYEKNLKPAELEEVEAW